jgi:hypothetical protein
MVHQAFLGKVIHAEHGSHALDIRNFAGQEMPSFRVGLPIFGVVGELFGMVALGVKG